MKKALKFIGLGLLAIIALFLIIPLFISTEFNYEKSIVINAPQTVVWENINSLADMDKWSPWDEYDPNMQKTWEGTDGQVGAKQSWTSPVEEVGTGSQTITGLTPNEKIETQLLFMEPFESEAAAYVVLSATEGGTRATWGFKSEMPYPTNIFKVLMDMESAMDKDFGRGLQKLKEMSEK